MEVGGTEGNRCHEVVVVTVSEGNHVTGQYCVVCHCLVRNRVRGNYHDVTLVGYHDYSGGHHVHEHRTDLVHHTDLVYHIDLVHRTILNVFRDAWYHFQCVGHAYLGHVYYPCDLLNQRTYCLSGGWWLGESPDFA